MFDIVIDNYILGKWDSFNHPDEAIICIERLVDNPCRMLINKYNLKTKVEYFNFILPIIAKLFNIDRNKLREVWVSTVYYYDCFGE